MTNLTYEELNFPTFVNTRKAATLRAFDKEGNIEIIELPFCDIPKAVVLMGGSMLCIGDTRCGKSLLMEDIHRNYFNGSADDGGKSNWNVARNDFSADAYFTTIDQSKIGEGKGMLTEAKISVERRVKALCNNIDEINLAIPEAQVEFFGMAEGRHKDIELGDRGYNLFMTSCNLNRINGDFAGTSQINRALLNRCGATLDFDFFKETDADRDILLEKGISGRRNPAPLRDISDKILNAYEEVKKASSQREPWLDAYIRLFSSGLDYCDKDSENRKKKIWPSRCGSCNFSYKDLCSLVKQSNTGTIGFLKRFATSLNYLVQLKHGQKDIDPFDLALESFKFTTYHGNLNGVELISTYGGEDQEQMRDVVEKIKEKVEPIKSCIDKAVESTVKGIPETRFIQLKVKGQETTEIYSEKAEEQLKKLKGKDISYKIIEPFTGDFAKENGIRIDWLPNYLKTLAQNYREGAK